MPAARTMLIGLSLTPPGPDAPGMEVAAPEYVRRAILFEPPSDAPTLLANAATIEWPRAASLWGDIGWLLGFEVDGTYSGWGNVVSITDDITPTVIRVDRGDVARFRAGTIVLGVDSAPSLYGIGPYGAGFYSHGGSNEDPRPFNKGGYGIGRYSRNRHDAIAGAMADVFSPASSACCGASGWVQDMLP